MDTSQKCNYMSICKLFVLEIKEKLSIQTNHKIIVFFFIEVLVAKQKYFTIHL